VSGAEIAGVLAGDQEPAQVRAVGEHGILARRAVLASAPAGGSCGTIMGEERELDGRRERDGPDSWARRRNVSMARRRAARSRAWRR